MADQQSDVVLAILRRVANGNEDVAAAFAREIVLAAKVGEMQDWAAAQQSSPSQLGKELEDFARHGFKLQIEILRMHPSTVDAINAANAALSEEIPSLKKFEALVGLMASAAQVASHRLDGGKRAGRPKANTGALVAESVKRAYERLTGKKATAPFNEKTSETYGPFVQLMKDVFAALEIKASASAQAKAICSKHKTHLEAAE